MRAWLLFGLLLSGCSTVERVYTQRPAQHTTVFRYTSQACEAPQRQTSKADDAELRRMTKSRDDWKRYAESLELLTPKDSDHAAHP